MVTKESSHQFQLLTDSVSNSLVFKVPHDSLLHYSTLLQSGIILQSHTGESLGMFLNNLPGFDLNYLADRVQTIFFDGNAVDDLEQRFSQTKHTLALSAAMPGLAGAIFRMNSLCAALRTPRAKSNSQADQISRTEVTLKLFNAIAREKGAGLFELGGVFCSQALLDFFIKRQPLIKDIHRIYHNDEVITDSNLIKIFHSNTMIMLRIEAV